MAKQDFYKLLEVARTATEAEIKKAYRRLAMKFHPDRNPDDPDAEHKFKEAKEAYEVLCDPQKRAVYDQFGHAGLEGGRGGGSAPARHSAISSARCSATSSPADSAVARKCSGAPICATSWSSISSRPCSAPPPRSRSHR